MDIQRILESRSIDALVLDVRGTLIHPSLDEPLGADLSKVLISILDSDTPIALVTAASLQTLEQLVINQLSAMARGNYRVMTNLILYVDSATAAYTFSENGQITPLRNYSIRIFEEDELQAVLNSLTLASSIFGIASATHKIKPGQVNFYCGGSLEERMEIASFINLQLSKSGYLRPTAEVPTAKATIDVALSNKAK